MNIWYRTIGPVNIISTTWDDGYKGVFKKQVEKRQKKFEASVFSFS